MISYKKSYVLIKKQLISNVHFLVKQFFYLKYINQPNFHGCKLIVKSFGLSNFLPASLVATTTPSSFSAVVRRYESASPSEMTLAKIMSPGLKHLYISTYCKSKDTKLLAKHPPQSSLTISKATDINNFYEVTIHYDT